MSRFESLQQQLISLSLSNLDVGCVMKKKYEIEDDSPPLSFRSLSSSIPEASSPIYHPCATSRNRIAPVCISIPQPRISRDVTPTLSPISHRTHISHPISPHDSLTSSPCLSTHHSHHSSTTSSPHIHLHRPESHCSHHSSVDVSDDDMDVISTQTSPIKTSISNETSPPLITLTTTESCDNISNHISYESCHDISKHVSYESCDNISKHVTYESSHDISKHITSPDISKHITHDIPKHISHESSPKRPSICVDIEKENTESIEKTPKSMLGNWDINFSFNKRNATPTPRMNISRSRGNSNDWTWEKPPMQTPTAVNTWSSTPTPTQHTTWSTSSTEPLFNSAVNINTIPAPLTAPLQRSFTFHTSSHGYQPATPSTMHIPPPPMHVPLPTPPPMPVPLPPPSIHIPLHLSLLPISMPIHTPMTLVQVPSPVLMTYAPIPSPSPSPSYPTQHQHQHQRTRSEIPSPSHQHQRTRSEIPSPSHISTSTRHQRNHSQHRHRRGPRHVPPPQYQPTFAQQYQSLFNHAPPTQFD